MFRIALVMLLLGSWLARGQKPFTRDYALIESAAGVKVNALAQDKTGYIWIGTDNGLICYNGQRFQKIQDSIQKPVTAIAVSGNNVWVGYSNGKIGVVTNLFVQPMHIDNGPSSVITSLSTNGINVLLASTEEEGAFVIINGIAARLNTANGMSDNFAYDLSVISATRLLAGTDVGINDMALVNNKIVNDVFTTKQGLPDNIVCVIRNIPGTPQYLIGTQEGGIALYNSENKKIGLPRPDGSKWAYGQVNDILPLSGKRTWVATEDGYLLQLDINDTFGIDVRPYYYPGKSFKKLLADKAGNIWCGTNHGLTMMTGEYLSGIRLGQPFSLYDATAMAYNDDALWIALKKELYQVSLKDTGAKLVPVFSAKATITSLFKDKDGRLWVGTLGNGLYYEKAKNKIEKVTGINELGADESILSIAGTSDRIWVAGIKGVEELSFPVNGKISLVKHHGKKTGIGSDYVYQLYADHKGNIWMATDGAGVCMYDGKDYHHWNAAFGPGGKVAYTITEDVNGDIWAGTMFKDLYRYHNNTWENLKRPEAQYADINISAVMANATGEVISVYERCIDEWYPQSHYFRHFNGALGMGIDSTSNVLNCAAKDGNGNVFLPYQHGILEFKNQGRQYDIRPSVHVVHPLVYSKPIPSGKHKFDHDENYVGFAFDGISYANHERLNYRYTLQGLNEGWIYTRDASVSFPKLSPGTYKFRVQVSLNPAFERPNEDDYEFTISAPYWETNWFYFLSAVFVFIIGYLYIKLREKRLRSISLLQQERMMFEYEHLKSQVNPHFLFNSLYVLSILIEEKKENALTYTVHLADLYRNMLTHSKNDLILLQEELEILMNYIHIQQTRFGDALHVNIEIPEDIKETRKIVPLALQLLVENAIKHNIVSKAQPLVITITAVKDEIIIRNFIQPKMSKDKGAGIGLVNIRQRYALLTKKPVSYGVHENEYIVKLPLL